MIFYYSLGTLFLDALNKQQYDCRNNSTFKESIRITKL